MHIIHSTRTESQRGFTIVEILVGIVIFAILVSGLVSAYKSIRYAYSTARQLNEMYTVLSACPEIDRALEYNSLTSSTNCYPNNTFAVENSTSGRTISYSPTLTVTPTDELGDTDPLKSVPDSKLVAIQLGFLPPNDNVTPLELRILITRNGIGQL